jgi:hypothetical protein
MEAVDASIPVLACRSMTAILVFSWENAREYARNKIDIASIFITVYKIWGL